MTPPICGRSTQPATSTVPPAITWASEPSTGAAVITGEQIRTRRRAFAIALAMRCERPSPWPGVNQVRTCCSPTGTGVVWTRPLRSTCPCVQSSSKLVLNLRRELGRGGGNDHVLLVGERVLGPVHRARPDRLAVAHDVLVVHQVGHARDRTRRYAERGDQLRVRLRWWRNRDRVAVVDVVEEAHRDPAGGSVRDRAGNDGGGLPVEMEVVLREVEGTARSRDEGGDSLRYAEGGLAAVGVRVDLEQRSGCAASATRPRRARPAGRSPAPKRCAAPRGGTRRRRRRGSRG